MNCDYPGCDGNAKYCIEWWGVDQFGGDPLVERERHTCSYEDHIIHLARTGFNGGVPDEINKDDTGKVEEGLLKIIKKIMSEEKEPVDLKHENPQQKRFSFAILGND